MGGANLKKRIVALCFMLSSTLFLFACQSTPEKSAVVSKADGLKEDAVADPLKEGETREFTMPEQWKAEEKRSNDRVTLAVDLPMDSLSIGNLPVLEVQNHSMTEEELLDLVDYFAGKEKLYVPDIHTKEVYKKIKSRIDHGEGGYANPDMRSYYEGISSNLNDAIEQAPSENSPMKEADIKFQKRIENKAYYAVNGMEIPDKNSLECFFEADVGSDRNAYIEAEQYSAKVNNVSSFSWNTGAATYSFSQIQNSKSSYSGSMAHNSNSAYYEELKAVFERTENAMNEQAIAADHGQKQADMVLADLNINNMVLLSAQKALWFPKGSIADSFVSEEDCLWNADLSKAETGYEYVYTRAVNDISVDQMNGSFAITENGESYSPPFSIERIVMVVTDSGVKSFLWEGMCEEVSTVAENTNLLSFEEIQKNIFDQMYYRYMAWGQPAEDKTDFTYEIKEAGLGYTYVTAYENPKNAWLVPCWFFTVREWVDGESKNGVSFERAEMQFMINAVDGGIIGKEI